MLLQSLKLVHFKSYESAEFQFNSRIIAVTGKNGSGKTNLLDAIHHLSLGRSAFQKTDSVNIQHEASFYRLDANLLEEDLNHRLEIVYPHKDKKLIVWDKSPYEKIGDHIGKLPLVFILPDEPYQMNESSEWRRNFIDNTLCQSFPNYLNHLSRYKRLLNQRNAALKYFSERNNIDYTLLETLEQELEKEANPIFELRKKFVPLLNLEIQKQYLWLSENAEQVEMIYQSELVDQPLSVLFQKNRALDLDSLRTNSGLHKDDFLFLLNGRPIKKLGSQGQQKSFLLSLKMAQYQFLKTQKGKLPWLLMDDIFDKLDDNRIKRLIHSIAATGIGQVFLTDARPERTKSLLDGEGIEFQVVQIN